MGALDASQILVSVKRAARGHSRRKRKAAVSPLCKISGPRVITFNLTFREDFDTARGLGCGHYPQIGTLGAHHAKSKKLSVRRRRGRGGAGRQYTVLREEGTERPYTSPLNDEHRSGIFSCAGCQLNLFSSRTKFDSHTGWPSFWAPLDHAVATRDDSSFGMSRTEVHCRRCGGHLGHVFEDGPKPTGLRYCMNGLAMNFTPAAT
jgi:methionine-R-sulfoxide reductase